VCPYGAQAQLGDVLGLTPMDVGSVHGKLAEESFRHQVQAVMGDGNLNKERMDALTGAQSTVQIDPCFPWRCCLSGQCQQFAIV
jgi:hypothetical protein